MTLIFDHSRSSKVKSNGAYRKPVGPISVSWGQTSYLLPFSRYFESKDCDLDLLPLKAIQSEAHGSNIVTPAVFNIHVKTRDLNFWPLKVIQGQI